MDSLTQFPYLRLRKPSIMKFGNSVTLSVRISVV
jgi:hypothetical protein